MNEIYLQCRVGSGLLLLDIETEPRSIRIADSQGNTVEAPVLGRRGKNLMLDAAALEIWSPENPVLYTLHVDDQEEIRFGFCELGTQGNSQVLVNGKPYYLRGYIRGIVAHDHPNLTGESDYEAARKSILQAKKYGFNLVRFHSTIPSPEFVRAADELGIFIHAEIGFAYEYDANGKPAGLALDNRNWREIIMRYRNNPSVMIFCIGNEMHQSGRKPEVKRLYQQGKELAPGKLIMDNSGWGEFDRDTADIYSQHIAYFFPYKKHRDMFLGDAHWRINGSVYERPLEDGSARRRVNPIRPVLAHEAVHYNHMPDYDALAAKFDDFCRKTGQTQIEKPRFMTDLPELIRRKGAAERMPDYVAASCHFKRMAVKLYLERLRLSPLCGFEMLQFADCFKYENKNGIVDCFDDDAYFDAVWMRQFNDSSVLLLDLAEECCWAGEPVKMAVHLSHFAQPDNSRGTLRLFLDDKEIYCGEDITTLPGLQKLLDLEVSPEAGAHELSAEFISPELKLRNQWNFWVYPHVEMPFVPGVTVCDRLTDDVFAKLEAGETVLLHYHRDTPGNQYYWPGAFDRFKPCIWDRGTNLGGIIRAPWVENTLYSHYFDLNMYSLIEEAYKLNLDDFPVKADELVSGVDKAARDRIRGLVYGLKGFVEEQTLRNFCYLLALRVGPGKLIVSTFNRSELPGVANLQAALLRECAVIEPTGSIGVNELKTYLEQATARGPMPEDVMTRFWELDTKLVEDTLFWEEAGIDLAKLH